MPSCYGLSHSPQVETRLRARSGSRETLLPKGVTTVCNRYAVLLDQFFAAKGSAPADSFSRAGRSCVRHNVGRMEPHSGMTEAEFPMLLARADDRQ